MIKICLIIHSLGIGGMERVMAQLANNFSEREHIRVDIILIGRKREVVYSLNEAITIHTPVFEFDNSRRMFHTLRTMKFLRKEVKKIDPDKILSFGEYWNNLVLLSLYGLKLPIFISDRSEPGKDLGSIQNFLRDRLYPCATGYIAQTGEAKMECLKREWNTNVKVIGNPVREIKIDDQVQKKNIVLTVGRLIETKHIDQLIRMFVEIGNPDWKLVIVGGNAKKKNLLKQYMELVNDLGAEDRVLLEGQQENIDQYYRESKIFAFTSSSEGFPNVIGEALSAGLPVVCYDCFAGPSDMVNHGKNGFLIPLFNKEAFKAKLSELMDSESLRLNMSNEAKTSIKKFDLDLISNKFYNFVMD